MDYGQTDTSTTTLSANQFPLSAAYVPNDALRPVGGGPKQTDGGNKPYTSLLVYIQDGYDVTQGSAGDAANANSVMGQLKQIKTNTASVTIGSLPVLPAGSNTIGNVGIVAGSAVIGGVELVDSGGTNKASISAGGAVKVDGSAVTQPVSGTFWQATQPIAAASLPLPSGASTSAKQPALGTAGSASADVLTVQGIASMTALKVDGSGVTQPISGSVSVSNFPGTQAVSGTVTVQQSTASSLKVDLSGTGANTTAIKVDGSAVTQPVSGTFWQATQPISGTVTANAGTGTFTNQQSNITTDYDSGAGTQNLTMFGVALPASGGAVAGGTSSNPLKVDPTGTTTQPVSVSGTVTVSATNLQTNLNQIAGSNVATAATGIQKVGLTDGTGTALTSTSNALDVNIKSGGGSGFSVVDEASWTAGTSAMVPAGGVFNDSAAALTSGQEGTVRLTNNRAVHVNLRDASANQLLGSKTSANSIPVVVASDQGAVAVSGTFWQTTQPVSGTVTANAGSGTFNNQQSNITTDYDTGAGTQTMTMFGLALPASGGSVAGGTATNPVRMDPTGTTTQPISAASLPLPSGASTSAKQPALGTAGTASSDVITVQGIASMTALKVDGSGVTQPVSGTFWQATQPVSGTVTANQGGSNWSVNVAQVGASNVATAATGVQKVGVVGNAGATVDSTVAAGTAPTNAIVAGSVYNSSAPAPTNGQAMAIQADQAGNTRTFPGIALAALSAWSSGTSLNATQTIFSNSGAEAVLVQLTQTTTLSAGAITFEVSYDGSTWNTIPASAVLDPTSTTYAQISLPYTVQASTNKAILLNMNGAQGLRIKLSTQITGTGTITPNYALLPDSPADTIIALSPTAANFNVTVGGSLPAGSNAIGGVTQSGTWTMQPGNTPNTSAWLVQNVAGTSGGSTPSHLLSVASNNATSLKASAGLLYGYSVSNTNASARWVKFYNKASSPNPASDTVAWAEQIPGNATVIATFPEGMGFTTGIAFAAVVNASDTDNTSIGAGDLSIDIRYK